MLHSPELLDALEALEMSTGFEGEAWRAVVGERPAFSPNSRGARWNPPGLDALYCSLSREGADLELRSMLRRQPVPISKPIRIAELKVKVERVIDLRAEGCLDLAGITSSQMVEESWTATRAVGAAAAWLGVGGLLVPSARHDDGNLVLFVSELGPQDVTEGS